MAHYARQLAAANPGIGDRIKVLHGKVEEIEVPEKVGAGGGGSEGCWHSSGQHSQAVPFWEAVVELHCIVS